MDQASMDILSGIITYLILGSIGFLQGKRIKRPVCVLTWIAILVCALMTGYVLPGLTIVSVFGFKAYANWILQGFVLGILIRLLVREIRLRTTPRHTPA
jgi:hypothetical protein